MSLEIWTAFVLASAALLAIPGPTVTVVVGHSIARGPSAAWATVPGVTLGDFVAMTASLLGAGAVLAASATLFTALKVAGAAYLIWLGVKMWRDRGDALAASSSAPRAPFRSIFANCFLVTAFNPKDIVFFVAFVPQFVDPAKPLLAQFVILEATFLTMVAANIALWSLTAGRLRDAFARPGRMRVLNRVGGGALIGAGLLTARA
ncbi:MAG: LysE family translocator [Pseudomonadota bacterium]